MLQILSNAGHARPTTTHHAAHAGMTTAHASCNRAGPQKEASTLGIEKRQAVTYRVGVFLPDTGSTRSKIGGHKNRCPPLFPLVPLPWRLA